MNSECNEKFKLKVLFTMSFWEGLMFTKSRITIYGLWFALAIATYSMSLQLIAIINGGSPMDVLIDNWILILFSLMCGMNGLYRISYHLK